MIDFSILVI